LPEKLPHDRRRKAPGDHLEKEIKVRVRPVEYLELVEASRFSHHENVTGYARDCMWIGHQLQQGGQREQILAMTLLQQKAHALAKLFRGEQLEPAQLSDLLADLAKQGLDTSFDDLKTA